MRAGSTVAQAYVGFPRDTGEPPQQLKGYEKVTLAPWRSERVLFRLTPAELSYFDESRGRFVVAHGRYTLSLGNSSRDLDERAAFER
jgi:beta-glucosidase